MIIHPRRQTLCNGCGRGALRSRSFRLRVRQRRAGDLAERHIRLRLERRCRFLCGHVVAVSGRLWRGAFSGQAHEHRAGGQRHRRRCCQRQGHNKDQAGPIHNLVKNTTFPVKPPRNKWLTDNESFRVCFSGPHENAHMFTFDAAPDNFVGSARGMPLWRQSWWQSPDYSFLMCPIIPSGSPWLTGGVATM